jgi:hypothetical protein
MKRRFLSAAGAVFALTLASASPASAVPIIFGDNAYEFVNAGSISWSAADAAATGMTFMGQSGHLATIGSAAENAFIDAMLTSGTEYWLGGFQPSGSIEPGGGWTWVNGDGLIPGSNFTAVYANWASGEPNNAGNAEKFLAMYAGGTASGKWNDEASLGNISGYVVEYDSVVPEPATLILVGSGLVAAVRGRRKKNV